MSTAHAVSRSTLQKLHLLIIALLGMGALPRCVSDPGVYESGRYPCDKPEHCAAGYVCLNDVCVKEALAEVQDGVAEVDVADVTKDTRVDTRDAAADADTKDIVVDTRDTGADTRDTAADTKDTVQDTLADTIQDTVADTRDTVADTRDAVQDTVADTQDAVQDTVADTQDVGDVTDAVDAVDGVDSVQDAVDEVDAADAPDAEDTATDTAPDTADVPDAGADVCVSNCTVNGAKRCEDSGDAYSTCELQGSCLLWSEPTSCPSSNPICRAGECGDDECELGEKQCDGLTVQGCADTNGDLFYEWYDVQVCAVSCEAGECTGCTSDAECDAPTPRCSSNTCVACLEDADCPGTAPPPPYCSTDNTCVECLNDGHCDDPTLPACSTDYTCVECTDDGHCAANATATHCDTSSYICIECLIDGHCGADPTLPACGPDGTCVGCTDDSHCTDAHCDTSTYTCVECLSDSHCTTESKPICKPDLQCGCLDHPDCENNPSLKKCKTAEHVCVECIVSGDCDGGEVCTANVCGGCVADCTGKDCGDDGCGGSCGECDPGWTCDTGVCTCAGEVCPNGTCCPAGVGCGTITCCEPEEMATADLASGSGNAIAVHGNYVYICGSDGLDIAKLEETSPGVWQLTLKATYASDCRDVFIRSPHAYIASGAAGVVKLDDDPSTPGFPNATAAALPEEASAITVAPAGGPVYVAAVDTLWVLDADLLPPLACGGPGPCWCPPGPDDVPCVESKAIFLDGDHIYTVGEQTEYDPHLRIVSVASLPPTPAAEYPPTAPPPAFRDSYHDLFVHGGYVYIATTFGVHMVDVGGGSGSPDNPKAGPAPIDPESAKGLHIDSGLLFVAVPNAMEVLRLDSPTTLTAIGGATFAGTGEDVYVDGSRAGLVSTGTTYWVFDISSCQ